VEGLNGPIGLRARDPSRGSPLSSVLMTVSLSFSQSKEEEKKKTDAKCFKTTTKILTNAQMRLRATRETQNYSN